MTPLKRIHERLGMDIGAGWPVMPATIQGKWVPRPIRLSDYNLDIALFLDKIGVEPTTSRSEGSGTHVGLKGWLQS